MKDDEKRFLIIDDEPDMCWALEQILKHNDIVSSTASNAGEALALLETNRFRFQVAFVDAKLPDIEGLELARLIRKNNPYIAIVMISGFFYKDGDEVKEALKTGTISAFIAKPFNNNEIVKLLSCC
ncbi:response regulator [Desulforhopalus vacuolatus]|uniref:response regulator n=1 Tax=Desulforhopalus vacuolatus TaxID=40414 RepID=UPI001962380D|nr:response regulator [Desulforhopalus vacuolatus]MBM9521220.1 response regulator [Desulforhopalus vacuolatus]